MNPQSPRIRLHGRSPYPHEQEAVAHAIGLLPDSAPYNVWALAELLDPSTGRLHEIDLLVLGYTALYLIEIKSGPGFYQGDAVDWLRTPQGERPRPMDAPLPLTNRKAKILKGRLRAKMSDRSAAPWVEPLIFLSHPDTDIRGLSTEGAVRVVTRDTLLRAVQHHDFAGADPGTHRRINAPQERDIIQAMDALGLRERASTAHVGAYQLGELVEDGPGYQDRRATHRDMRNNVRRARTYLVPSQTSIEHRQRLHRAADREAQLLYDLREHPGILPWLDYIPDAPLGPTVLFDDFAGSQRLDAFVRRAPACTLYDRVAIIEQVGRALDHCHKKGVVHGALGPEAVLIRRHPDTGALETRLYNFQLGAGAEVEGTSHWSMLAAETWALYQAPEVIEDPASRSPQSDVFSLGALAFFVLTGRPPGATVADMLQRLERDRCLDPRVVDDTIPTLVADCVAEATRLRFADRYNSAGEWIELLLSMVTEPEPADPAGAEPSPLEARPGDLIGGDLLVHGVLGHGATARVLRVERDADGRELALKISLSPDHDERLAAEAAVLDRLRHSRIVQLIEPRTIGGRPCLLLSLAGTETLHRKLARDGSLGLDYAARYGEDLLFALEYLEEQKVTHRDIKPANLGVGTVANKAHRLILFDFSLVDTPAGHTALGTAAYRDPFLRARGAWDSAADRWSAAVTLHEMLTGVRPGFGDRGGTALDDQAELRLAAERFDAAVRDPLVAFFQKALARDVEARFDSARAMRKAWEACVAGPEAPRPRPGARTARADTSPDAVDGAVDDATLAAIAPDTAIEALPLSVRARNALDRAGLIRAQDLLTLADNRLSAIRGIGSKVAAEILDFRDRWRRLGHTDAAGQAQPFFAGYLGDDTLVATLAPAAAGTGTDKGIDPAVLSRWTGALVDAGLHTLAAVAAAPAHQLKVLAGRHGLDTAPLRAVLNHENRRADERNRPSTLEGWVAALLPGRAKGDRYLRVLFGLDEPFAGRLDATPRQVAEAMGVTRANVYATLNRARARWARHPAMDELAEQCAELVAAAGGALPLDRAAADLAARVAHDRAADPALIRARAATLLRVVTEVERNDPAGLRYVRLGRDTPWLCASHAHADTVQRLGDAADDLARRPVIASPGEARRVFSQIAHDTPLSGLAADKLAELAAAASRDAARSARLEIYPRGMAAERALELSAAVLTGGLTGGLTPDSVRDRVQSRYPDAAPLPERPALDALLEPHGLRWNDTRGTYDRPGEASSSHNTLFTSSLTALSSDPGGPGRSGGRRPLPPLAQGPSAEVVARDAFEDRMRDAVDRGALRILGVTADKADAAERALARAFGLEVINFDRVFPAALHRQVAARNVRADIYQADLAGPAHKTSWTGLTRLAARTAEVVAGELFPPRRPMLLTRPGLIARYELRGFLDALVQASHQPEAAALFVLVPGHDTGGVPRINGHMDIPGILASQALWVPGPWIKSARARRPPVPQEVTP